MAAAGSHFCRRLLERAGLPTTRYKYRIVRLENGMRWARAQAGGITYHSEGRAVMVSRIAIAVRMHAEHDGVSIISR